MTLLWCSAVTAVLIILYAVLQPLLAKRYSERSRYYGWLIIVIGLLIPFRPSLSRLIPSVSEKAATVGTAVRENITAAAVKPIEAISYQLPTADPVTVTKRPLLTGELLAAVWMSGVILFLLYHGIRYYRCNKMVRRWQEPITVGEAFTVMEELRAEMGPGMRVRLYLCPCIGSPMMMGFLNPRVLLPHNEYTGDELRFVLRHELIHYRRRDLWYKGLVLLASAVHWFNPAVYLMGRTINAQCESSCDLETVKHVASDQRQQYIRLILTTMRQQSAIKTLLATSFTGGKKKMKKRISAIVDMKMKKSGLAVIAVLLVFTLGTGAAYAEKTGETGRDIVDPVAEESEESAVAVEASLYQKYEKFGLSLNKEDKRLYFQDKLVRYFEDFYPAGGGNAGIDYLYEKGVIDVYAVRDLDNAVRNSDGSYEPGGRLTGIKTDTQEEFDKRDISELTPVEVAAEAVEASILEVADDPQSRAKAVAAEEEMIAIQEVAEKTKAVLMLSQIIAVAEEDELTGKELVRHCAEYEAYGITYNRKQNALYYKGQLAHEF